MRSRVTPNFLADLFEGTRVLALQAKSISITLRCAGPRAQGDRAALWLEGRAPAYPRGRPEVRRHARRIRQIEAKTLAKLKSYRDSQRLRDFLD